MGTRYGHLPLEERWQLAHLQAAGRSIRQIAATLDRAPSTVAREVKRNRAPAGAYQPVYAAQQAQARRWRGARLERDEECRAASERTQVLVTTHSPFFLNALRPKEVRVLWRDDQGYTQSQHVTDLPEVQAFLEHGGLLGNLWMEGYFGVGDPLVNQGAPTIPPQGPKQ